MWQTIKEQELETLYTTTLADFWTKQVTTGHFSGKDGVTIQYAYCIPENPVESIAFSNGRIETLVKFKEFFYECYQNNIAIFTMDHRGQGLSGRMTLDSHRGYVDNFADYVDDFTQFVAEIVTPKCDNKPILVCHSMGSAIGFLTAARSPELFSRAMFCSPMFGIKPTVPEPFLSTVLTAGLAANRLFGKKPWYAIGQGPYIDIPFAINTLTHSQLRYKLFREEYKRHKSAQLGGVTYHWIKEAFAAIEQIYSLASDFPLSVRVLISGADKVVDNHKIRQVVERLPNVKTTTIDGARHELLFEQDKYRQIAVNAIFDFVSPQ